MTEKKPSLGAYVRYYGMASFTIRTGALSLTGKNIKFKPLRRTLNCTRETAGKGD